MLSQTDSGRCCAGGLVCIEWTTSVATPTANCCFVPIVEQITNDTAAPTAPRGSAYSRKSGAGFCV
eukprot:9258605-Pyramimonas_sp.AAC.1